MSDRGCKTIEGAMNKYDLKREDVWVYGCRECGMVMFDRWRSKYSIPIECPRCGEEDMIEDLGDLDFCEKELGMKFK